MAHSINERTLLERCRDAASRRSSGDAQSAYFDYGRTHCLRPVRISQVDCSTGKPRELLVPCGRCWRCRTTKKNEWVTRMYSHCESFAHVYYVTLTYRSLRKDITPGSPTWLLRDYLKDALWHLDSRNSNSHLGWNPTILCKEHYQGFMKRLRRNTGLRDITYAITGEYGKRFSRPHFHLVLWTNGVLTREDIEKAWSLRFQQYVQHSYEGEGLFRTEVVRYVCRTSHSPKARQILFGHVDFHDLVANGTFFDPSVQVQLEPGSKSSKSGSYVFSYVCKYLLKGDDKFPDSRVRLAWDALNFRGNSHLAWLERLMASDSDSQRAIKFFKLRLSEKYPDAENSLISLFSYFNYQRFLKQHETDSFSSSLVSLKDGELCFHQAISPSLYYDVNSFVRFVGGVPQFRFPATFDGFRSVCRPFFQVSRSTPLGSLYSDAHLSEHAVGVFRSTPLQPQSSYVVPSYFYRRCEEWRYPLRSSRCKTSLPSLSKGCLPLLLADFGKMVEGEAPQYVYTHPERSFSSLDPSELTDLIRHHSFAYGRFRAVVTHSVSEYSDSDLIFHVALFQYVRSLRQFVNVGFVDFFDWVQEFYHPLEVAIQRLRNQHADADRRMHDWDAAGQVLDSSPDLKDRADILQNIDHIDKMVQDKFEKEYDLFHNYLE